MGRFRFGWADLYAGNRFLAPLSEEALLEAGRAAELREGSTLVEFGCGNGAAAVFWAEEFHAYVRGVEEEAELIETARGHARRSGAVDRIRLFAARGQVSGPVDVVCALRGPPGGLDALLRPGGRFLLGRYLGPAEWMAAYPSAGNPPGRVRWRREATPLEWERFYAPQERALRVYRRRLHSGDAVGEVALAADRQIGIFRSNAAHIRYELSVRTLPGTPRRPAGRSAFRRWRLPRKRDPPERRLASVWAPLGCREVTSLPDGAFFTQRDTSKGPVSSPALTREALRGAPPGFQGAGQAGDALASRETGPCIRAQAAACGFAQPSDRGRGRRVGWGRKSL